MASTAQRLQIQDATVDPEGLSLWALLAVVGILTWV
jgi:hypothetical protein